MLLLFLYSRWSWKEFSVCCAGEYFGGYFESHLSLHSSTLARELRSLPLLSRCCALSGIMSVMPKEAFSTLFHLPAGSFAVEASMTEEADEWDLLLDGCLPAACRLLEDPCDPDIKFYALGALTLTLQRIYEHLQVPQLKVTAKGMWTRPGQSTCLACRSKQIPVCCFPVASWVPWQQGLRTLSQARFQSFAHFQNYTVSKADKADIEQSTAVSSDKDAAAVHGLYQSADKTQADLAARRPKIVLKKSRQRIMDALQGHWEVGSVLRPMVQEQRQTPLFQSHSSVSKGFCNLPRKKLHTLLQGARMPFCITRFWPVLTITFSETTFMFYPLLQSCKCFPALQSSLPQNVKQVNTAFEALLDVLQFQINHGRAFELTDEHANETRLFFKDMARQALALGSAFLQEATKSQCLNVWATGESLVQFFSSSAAFYREEIFHIQTGTPTTTSKQAHQVYLNSTSCSPSPCELTWSIDFHESNVAIAREAEEGDVCTTLCPGCQVWRRMAFGHSARSCSPESPEHGL